MSKKLRIVLSLFDGCSCGQAALNRGGIKYEQYYASEIDKHAIKVTMRNFPSTIQLGDVLNWRNWDIDWSRVDLLIGGSPCQGFSFAGKQLNFNDPRSKLFFVYVEILAHIRKFNPDVKFLLENVRMKKEYENIISQFLEVSPVIINSALVSAQNRVRLYWSNFGYIPQPEDKKIYLKDILQPADEVDSKYYLSKEQIEKINFSGLSKYFNKDIKILGNSSYWRKCLQVFDTSGKTETIDTQTGGSRGCYVFIKIDKKGNIKNNQDKASTFTAGAHSGGNHSDMDVLLISLPHGYHKGSITIGKSQTLTSNSWEHNNFCVIKIGDDLYAIRRLTEIESERLQTLDDDYTSGVSPSQRYKMLGNGWTVDAIVHLFKYIANDNNISEFQPDLFGAESFVMAV